MKVLRKERESGIELLKIIAILLIIISHATQTLGSVSNESAAFVNLYAASTDFNNIVLILFRHFGTLGNDIFFICSAWFLCDVKAKRKNNKMLTMVMDVWLVSVLCLAVFMLLGVNVSNGTVFTSVFPITFSNNWYVTCYLVFYAIFPYLNMAISKMSQRTLLCVNIASFAINYLVCYIKFGLFFSNQLIEFIAMFFMVAYIKKYLVNLDVKYYVRLLIFGIIGFIVPVLIINFLGTKIDFFASKVLIGVDTANPFLLIIAISLVQIFSRKKFVNVFVNRLSALSLLIYLFHDNIIFAGEIRPKAYDFIYEHLGYDYLFLWVLVYAVVLFVGAAVISFIYQNTFHRLTSKISDVFVMKASPIFNKYVDKLQEIGNTTY